MKHEGYTGEEQWVIITELSEEELFEKYHDIISRYIPFVLLSVEQGKAVWYSHMQKILSNMSFQPCLVMYAFSYLQLWMASLLVMV